MSLCENRVAFPRGKICKDCPLGKAGNVSKIVNNLEKEGLVSWLAGNIWLKRGGGLSSQEESESDYVKALKIYTLRVCKSLN